MKIWEKEITFWKYTRWIDREYNNIISWGCSIGDLQNQNITLENIQKWNDFLVNKITWLTQKEIDDLDNKEFDLIMTEINKITNKVPTKA